jgi:hypothetical protein
MPFKLSAVVALVALVSSLAPAQGVDPGLHWQGSSGASAGSSCGGFTCTTPAIPATIGETVTITLRGTLGTSWAIGTGATATSCIAIPGIHNFLVLDNPTLALSGVFTQGDPMLSCPGGFATLTFTFPVLPPWTPLAIQALAQRPDLSFSFTSAITIWVL